MTADRSAASAETALIADPDLLHGWRTGPRWYHVIAASIQDPRVEERRRHVAATLADLITPTTPGQAHVTISAAGFTPPQRVMAPVEVALEVGAPATFASAVYLSVTGRQLGRLRGQCLRLAPADDRSEPYVPHVTVGCYYQPAALTEVRTRLGRLPAAPLRTVGLVEHLVVDTRSPTGRLHRWGEQPD